MLTKLTIGVLLVHQVLSFTIELTQKGDQRRDNQLQLHDVYAQTILARYDVFYEADVSVGTPPQVYRVLVDTGSPYFWIPRVDCKNRDSRSTHCEPEFQLYDPKASRTSVQFKKIFLHEYGVGKVSGIYYEDTFAFGDAKTNSSLRLKRPIRFGGATNTQYGDQGILGLSLPKKTEFGSSVFDEFVKQRVISNPIFTIFLRQCGDVAECKNAGRITLGSVDNQNCGREIGFVNVEPNTFFWKFKLDELAVGGYKLRYRASVVVDSGSNAVHLPSNVIRGIAKEIGAEESGSIYLLPCSVKFNLTIRINGHDYTIPGHQLTRQVSRSKCQLLLSPRDQQPWILGASMLRTFCVVHDWAKRQLRFTELRNYKQPTAMDSMITAVRLQAVNDETTEQPQQATRRLQTARKTVTYPGTPNPTATIGSSTKPVEPFAQAANKLYNELKAAKRFVLADSLEHQIAEITDVFKRHLNVGEAAVCEQNGRQPSNGLVSADSQLTMSMLEERLKNQEQVNEQQDKRLLNLENEIERLNAIQVEKKRRRSATTNTASETQTVPPQQAPASHQLLGREQVFGPQHVNYSAVQQRMMPIPSTQPRLSHGQMIPNQNPTLPSLFPSHRMFTRLPMPTQQPTFIDSSRQQMSFQQPNQPTNQPTVPYNHPSHQFNATGYSFVPQSVPQSQPQLHPQYHSAPTFAMIANAVRTQNAQNPANSPLPNTHYHHCIGPIKSANGNKISGLSTMSQPTCSQQPQSSGSNSSVPKTTSSMKTDDMSDESNDSFYHVEDE